MRFEKWQALGNDYVILEAAALPWELTTARARRLCEPHTGIGSDGILLLSPSEDPEHVAALRIFNPDGSEAKLSGNGAREAIMYLRRTGQANSDEFSIITAAGPIRPQITGPATCTVDMGHAATSSPDYPSGEPAGAGTLSTPQGNWSFQHVSIGNPQCAIHWRDLEALELGLVGPPIERHELFPNRTNVSWFCETTPGRIRARIFERGVGETLSSGTGACGAAIAHHLQGGPGAVVVELDGGELEVQIGPDLSVTLSGWAIPVYRGELSPEMIKELDETQ